MRAGFEGAIAIGIGESFAPLHVRVLLSARSSNEFTDPKHYEPVSHATTDLKRRTPLGK